ncbi:MAG TPA: hypothetical protein HPP77_08510 [Candidatus Hydrogenedentes bacterium]|nr:hypothetical protein [Candidatus Hydrogenedentota bacterium]HIJ74187.1 hypothetical protein [Candidatus Hydrogenedentota bacterium]
MTNRERYLRLFAGEDVDRAPFLDVMGYWPSTVKRWRGEGLDLPENASWDTVCQTIHSIIGFDGGRGSMLRVQGYIWPEFERKILAEKDGIQTIRNGWGGIERNEPGSDVMPVTIKGPVADRASWEAIKERLDPDTPGRFPENWAAICQEAQASGEPVYCGDLPLGFFGAPRELLGFERQAMLFYEDPELMHEILDTLCDLWIALFTRVQQDVPLDWYFVWEDMCSKNGPLIAPALFAEFLLPRYKRLTDALRKNGCKHVMVDSDGDERPLVPLWIEGGVDIVFPWETQFGLDITEVRRQYPALGIIGGIDKFALAHGREAIDKELKKVPFMLTQGRYIPGLDHGVPPDVSWDNYRYFYDKLRELIWTYPPEPS